MLHESLGGARLTRDEYQRELPVLRDRLLDARFELRKTRGRAVAVIVTASAVSSWCAIRFFLALIERTGMLPYVVYRLLLGATLLYLFL